MRAVGAIGLLDTGRAIGDSRPCRHFESCRKTLRDIGTLDTVRDDGTLRHIGTLRVIGIAGTLGTVRDDGTLKFILM